MKIKKTKKNAETANENEVYILKQTIEAANRKIFACESDGLHLTEENKRIKLRAKKDIDGATFICPICNIA